MNGHLPGLFYFYELSPIKVGILGCSSIHLNSYQ